ncbi:hypothetical protein Tco_0092989 [Tanacetum coccineum]
METQKPLLKDEDGKEVDVHMYRYQLNLKVSHLNVVKKIFSARNRQWLQIPQQKLSMWLLQVVVDKCFGFRINYLIMDLLTKAFDEKTKKSVRLMMEKLCEMELELILVKTITDEVQLHALVDGKKIIVTESIVRRDLQLEDDEAEVSIAHELQRKYAKCFYYW